jgi:hypothetical protein
MLMAPWRRRKRCTVALSVPHRPSDRFSGLFDDELLAIAELMLRDMNYKFSPDAREAFVRYIGLRKTQPLFSNARSIRNALDRMRPRQANRLVADLDRVLTADDIVSLEAPDVLASRVFGTAKI